MKKVKITYEELQKWKAKKYDNSFISGPLNLFHIKSKEDRFILLPVRI